MADNKGGQRLVEQFKEEAFDTIDGSELALVRLTREARAQHETRSTSAVGNTIFNYFKQRDGEPLSPEEVAILHYCVSVGECLPTEEELATRIEAAERSFEIIEAADMLYIPGKSANFGVTLEPQQAIKLDAQYARSKDDLNDDKFRVCLSGLGYVSLFSLIGKEDLATPISTPQGVEDLFRDRKADIVKVHTAKYESEIELPLIAGKKAVARYAMGLGTQIPVEGQEINLGYSPGDKSFYGMAKAIYKLDALMAKEIVEEVRAIEPAIINMVIGYLEEAVLSYLKWETTDSEKARILESVSKWLEKKDVKLFFTGEQVELIKEKLLSTYEDKLQTKTDSEIAAFEKVLKA